MLLRSSPPLLFTLQASLSSRPAAQQHRRDEQFFMKKQRSKRDQELNFKPILDQESILGSPWVPIYETNVEFESVHYEKAVSNIIKQPNINSTVIMRADILIENIYDPDKGNTMFTSKDIGKVPEFPNEGSDSTTLLYRYHDDVKLRDIPLDDSRIQFCPKTEIVRRVIPRNPFKDYIINQTLVILVDAKNESLLVVYIPHINLVDETPFYLPPVKGIGMLFHNSQISIHYLPFENSPPIRSLDINDRSVRIAMRLIETSKKHSQGIKDGYEKRVNHDLVVSKELFQNRYISLKKKYSSELVGNWVEKTDPKKHIFEDLAIAAFLIELWNLRFTNFKENYQFMDLGCGNGLLVHILIQEGYKGKGIDARQRKSWATYPENVRQNLQEKIIIPSVLLESENLQEKYFQIPDFTTSLITYYAASKLKVSPQVCTTDFPENTFIIGNHSDELTCWIPLFDCPFMVIPCCSHALSGAKVRYSGSKTLSTYAALVEHVEQLAKTIGWIVEKESLRIPSTRNMALIGINKHSKFKDDTSADFGRRLDRIVTAEMGIEAWVENSLNLMKKGPRDH